MTGRRSDGETAYPFGFSASFTDPGGCEFLRYALGSLAECDTQLIIAESLGYGTYTKSLKACIMSLTMGIRAYAKTLGD